MARFNQLNTVQSSAQPGCWAPQSVTKSGLRSDGYYPSRVGKNRLPSTKQSHFKISNSDKIADLIDEHRKKLGEDSDTKLRRDEDALNQNIDALKIGFQSQIELLRDAEGPILQSMANEKLRIASEPQRLAETAGHQFEVVKLRDRVQAFEAYIREKEQEIVRLMAEWNKTQIEILCMAVEIVGRDKFNLLDEIPQSIDQNVRQAIDKHKHIQQGHENDLAKIASVEASIKELTQQTKKIAKTQQKELKIKQKKDLKGLTVYLRGLVETSSD
ncbi:hypothetical protein DV736_g327, partial [Chaetothyriales sp. CBS 134916]